MKNELTIKEQIEKFNRLYSTYITQDISELSKSFDKYFFEKNTAETLKLIEKTNKIKENSLTLANKMQLNYDIATAYSDLRNIDHVDNCLEKEILHYRKVIMFYEENHGKVSDDELFFLNYIAMRTYTNLGNALKATARYGGQTILTIYHLGLDKDVPKRRIEKTEKIGRYSLKFIETFVEDEEIENIKDWISKDEGIISPGKSLNPYGDTHHLNIKPSDDLITKLIQSDDELNQNIGFAFLTENIARAVNDICEIKRSKKNGFPAPKNLRSVRNILSTEIIRCCNLLESCNIETTTSLLFNYWLVHKMQYPTIFARMLMSSSFQDKFINQIEETMVKIDFIN